MSGKFISYILAAAVAVTGLTSAPARAGDRDVAAALAALAGIAVIGAAVHESRKDKHHATRHRNLRPLYRSHRPHRAAKRHHRRKAITKRAYRQGYRDHRRVVRERRAERRAYRRSHRAHRGKGHHRYSARPRRHAN